MPMSQDQIRKAAHFYFALLGPQITESATIAGCLAAKSFGLAGVFVKPCYVWAAVSTLRNSDIKTGTVIGYPNGGNSRYALVAETKRALTKGAQVLVLSIHLGYLIEDNLTKLNAEIQSICGLAHMNGAQAFTLIDPEYLSESQLTAFRNCIVKDSADGIIVVRSPKKDIRETMTAINFLHEGLKGFLKIGILSDQFTTDEQIDCINAGFSLFITEDFSDKT